MNKYFLTTPIYYVNDVPHVGHAYTTLAADILARYYRQKIGAENVFFLTGTDEHGLKVAQAAKEKGLSPREFADSVAPRFEAAWKLFNVEYDYFIRTTDPRHEKIVSDLMQKIYDSGYIYKGTYKGLYCVGCEKFLTETELVSGRCPLHPNFQPIHQEEENYFLKLGELSQKVLEKIEEGKYEILPQERKNEILERLKGKVDDISISRSGVNWGIPVPWDKSQTIYVWVDALINYYSATKFLQAKEKFWPADLHLIGKDILWFHAVIWQALLIAAKIDLPRTIFAHGFFTIDGQKMSKSLGNVISPEQLVDRYGVDGARYLVISAYPFGADGDISFSRFDEKYNADLANGLGNTVARVAKLAENSGIDFKKTEIAGEIYRPQQKEAIEKFQLDAFLQNVWSTDLLAIDAHIDQHKPWTIKDKFQLGSTLQEEIDDLKRLALKIKPFLPATAGAIEKQFKGPKISSVKPLFPRL